MLRSVLEKVLNKNGYAEVTLPDGKGGTKRSKALLHRIEAAADDGVITQARKQKAHENIRVLGNDVLHDEWRFVSQEEFELSLKYSQRILEDLYDDRTTVEAILQKQKRLILPAVPADNATTNPN
jgi:hypothetical protein